MVTIINRTWKDHLFHINFYNHLKGAALFCGFYSANSLLILFKYWKGEISTKTLWYETKIKLIESKITLNHHWYENIVTQFLISLDRNCILSGVNIQLITCMRKLNHQQQLQYCLCSFGRGCFFCGFYSANSLLILI